MNKIQLSKEQLEDGKRLKTNMFKTLYKIESNTYNYSSKIDLIRETIKYPLMLSLGTLGSILGAKHLHKLHKSASPKEIFRESTKYIGIISLFSLPTLLINSYFAKFQKMGAQISDMITMQNLEDYRFFADYSKYQKKPE